LQRVLLARAIAQQSPVVLLDEPNTALDIGHQQEVLDVIDRLRHERSLTIVSTMHDLTLAGLYAERLALLDHGRVVAEGDAESVLTEEHLERYYGARVRVVREPGGIVVVPQRAAIDVCVVGDRHEAREVG
jgi:iron complex transport system ATP-binding protein